VEKVIITGGNGFLGKRLTELLKDSYDIFLFNRQNNRDVTKIEDFEELRADYVIHLAALTRNQDERKMFDINVGGTLNVLEFCKNVGAKLIFASSSAVYGNAESPIKEDSDLDYISFYGLTKSLGETLCKFYNERYNLPIVILRIFNLYGPGQQEGFVIPDIIHQLTNEKIILRNSCPKRDFIYIDDVVESIRKSMKQNSFEIMNVGTGRSYSIKEAAEKIACGKKIECLQEKKENDIYADIKKAKEIISWESKINLDEGLKKILG
jgi:UDP-glucose 4-epimerase